MDVLGFYLNEFLRSLVKLDNFFLKPLAYPNGLLDLYIETFGRTPFPVDQPDARPLPTQDNTTQKHADTHP
jgi:hypothetical protein